MNRGRLRIGTSGYQYDHWRGLFYPPEVPKSRWLPYYATQFDTVEINNTFYRLPEAKAFDHWREQVPEGFLFALKYSRFGTHVKRLRDPAAVLGNFMPRAEHLGSMLGPILAQLPPNWHADSERLKGFLEALPRKRRFTVEFRDPSWLNEEVFGLLKKHKVALCIHDKIRQHPAIATADFVYLRYHGGFEEEGSYGQGALKAEAKRIKAFLDNGLDVYAYFNNDLGGHAVHNAQDLRSFLGGS